MQDCIFCKIIRGEIPSFKVYEDERVFAFMDINPISNGHTLIIPKAHAENIWEMTAEDLSAVMAAAKKIGDAIRETLQPEGMACLQLNGRAVNQVVMHYHFHLIPRSKGEGELPMTQWELVAGDMEKVGQTAKRISASLSGS
jgi:histidine triad (HIT) family protein